MWLALYISAWNVLEGWEHLAIVSPLFIGLLTTQVDYNLCILSKLFSRFSTSVQHLPIYKTVHSRYDKVAENQF